MLEFSVPPNVVRARLYIAGLGYYICFINGQRVSDKVLGTFTTFEKRVLYDTYDVTYLLQTRSALAVMLGHGTPARFILSPYSCATLGWYAQSSVNVGPLSLLVQLHIETADNSQVMILSDTTWKTIQGPIIMDDIYLGETYDARMETPV